MRAVGQLDRSAMQVETGMLPRPFVVRSRREELADCVTLELAALDGDPLPFEPGQFTMLYVHGIGEVAISISGDPAASDSLIHTVRGVGAVSQALCRLSEGDRVGVRGPVGNSWPIERAVGKHLMIVAGGLGLAPVRPIIYWALANRERLASINIIYGTRAPDQILFAQQLLGLSAADRVRVGITVDLADQDWSGQVGVVTDLIPSMLRDPAETVAMVCGPEIMMRFTGQALAGAGVPAEEIFLSMERNMKCGIGWCGHCQLGPHLICRDGPVFPYPAVRDLMSVWEL